MPNYGTTRRKSIDVTEAPQNHKDILLSLDSDEAPIQEIEPVTDMAHFDEHAAREAFYNEPVTIFLYEGQANDVPFVQMNINGESPLPGSDYLVRGKEHTVKRKFVEVLANMRPVTYTQPYKGSNSDLENYYKPNVAVRFPFSVVHDANPKGVNWIKGLMGQ